jgi:hypothetical protein
MLFSNADHDLVKLLTGWCSNFNRFPVLGMKAKIGRPVIHTVERLDDFLAVMFQCDRFGAGFKPIGKEHHHTLSQHPTRSQMRSS